MAKSTIRNIPLDKLHASEDNARRTEPKAAALDQLKASIRTHDLLQNLVVRDGGTRSDKRFRVTGGRRRLTALQALAEDGEIAADFPVPCRVTNGDASDLEVSLTENEVREAMNPVDAYHAYRTLNENGQTTQQIATRFGVPERRVHQLLRLASCAPELLAAFRDDAMDEETLQAFTVTTDHERQREVWRRIKANNYTPNRRQIQAMLTEGKVPATAAPARLVGIEAYEAAGGRVDRDLFADDDERGIYLVDANILDRLVDEKLQAAAEQLLERWKWAQVELDVDYNRVHAMHRIEAVDNGGTEHQQARWKRLRAELDERDEMSEAEYDAAGGEAHYAQVEQQVADLEQEIGDHAEYRPEEMAYAGCIVTLGDQGRVVVHEGLVRDEDRPKKKAPAPAPIGAAPAGRPDPITDAEVPPQPGESAAAETAGLDGVAPEPAPAGPVIVAPTVTNLPKPEPEAEPSEPKGTRLAAALCDDLRALRTEVIKSRLADNPGAALDLLVSHLAGKLLAADEERPSLGITAGASARYPIRQERHAEIESVIENDKHWKRRVKPPAGYAAATTRAARFAAIRAMDGPAKMKLLAGMVAMTLTPQLAFDDNALDEVEMTVAVLGIDFAAEARPTRGLFWSQLTRDRMLRIAAQTLGAEWVARHRDAKKSELAQRMADAFGAGTEGPDVDAEAAARALAWAMPGLKAFDQAERTGASAAEGSAEDGPQQTGPAATAEPAPEPEHELPSFMQ